MDYQSLVKQFHKDPVRLSKICNLANLGHYSLDEKDSEVQSFFVDLEEKVFSTWNQAEVFVYRNKAFLVREFTTDGEDEYDEDTKVLDDLVWLEVIELILEEVRRETLYKLLNYI
jgi:hypothetical protein